MPNHSRRAAALEPAPGLAIRAAAATAFVQAVQRHLPSNASDELCAIAGNASTAAAIAEWAARWHVNCPCVREWARGVIATRARLGPHIGPQHISRGYGYDIPLAWSEKLSELNATMLDAMGWDPRTYYTAVDPEEPFLAPIAANPLAESRKEFVARAGGHWDARAELARRMGYTSMTPARELERHCAWLARHQLLAESFATIAQRPQQEERTVKKAISRLRKLLELPPRRQPGRPRK